MEVRGRNAPGGGGRPVGRVPVRRAAEFELGRDGIGDIARIVLQEFEGGGHLPAGALDLRGRKGRVHDHVGGKVKGHVCVVGENAQREVRLVPVGAVVHRTARAVNGLGDLECRAVACALVEQSGDDLSRAGQIGRIGLRSGFDHQPQRQHG